MAPKKARQPRIKLDQETELTVAESNSFSYEELENFASYLKKRAGIHHPKIGIIAGSGQGVLVDAVKDPVVIHYTEIKGFPQSTVSGHSGEFVFGTIDGHEVMVMSGRLHLYEGYPAWKVTAPIRIMHLLGIKILIATNAAGSVSKSMKIGDIVILKDHIYLPGLNGNNPLIGKNDERFGPRFLDAGKPYSKSLRELTKKVAAEIGLVDVVKEGVYCMVSGPMYETPAEVRYLRGIGADVVGMSTCPEVIAAIHCGMDVLAMTLVTDICVDDIDDEGPSLTHEDVLKVGAEKAGDIKKLIEATIRQMNI